MYDVDNISLKIKKVILTGYLSTEESKFVVSIINATGSIENAIIAMLEYVSNSGSSFSAISDDYSLHQHFKFGASIFAKTKKIEITSEDVAKLIG